MTTTNAASSRLRGARSADTRALHAALSEPATVGQLAARLGWGRQRVWSRLRGLLLCGMAERVSPGVYRAVPRQAGGPRKYARRFLSSRFTPPPARQGRRWGTALEAWLIEHYPNLGHRRCAELLQMHPAAVHAKAADLGLRYGDLDDDRQMLLTDLAALLGVNYTSLWMRAHRAGVLSYPAGSRDMQVRRAALVPQAWADVVADEHRLPDLDDVSLAALRAELNISKTHLARLVTGRAFLRTATGDSQPRAYVSAQVADEVRRSWRIRERPVPVGREGVLTALAAAGAEGLTERELRDQLGVTHSAIRHHLAQMLAAGEAERTRGGSPLDPYVVRLARYQTAPLPPQRTVAIPGRPPKRTAQEAAD